VILSLVGFGAWFNQAADYWVWPDVSRRWNRYEMFKLHVSGLI
jgi:hypothetical protein